MYAGSIAFFLTGAVWCVAAAAQPAPERECFSTVETRDRILANGLAEPFAAMRHAAALLQAEAIGARLCRWDDELVYEISLLRRDGRVIRSFFDAKTGQIIDAKTEKKRED
jgi:uncharacterized membrane protein YkoI